MKLVQVLLFLRDVPLISDGAMGIQYDLQLPFKHFFLNNFMKVSCCLNAKLSNLHLEALV